MGPLVIPAIQAGISAYGAYQASKASRRGGPNLDISALLNQINAGGARQREIAGNLKTQLAPGTQQYSSNLSGLVNQARTQGQARGQQYLGDVGTAIDTKGNLASDLLKQRTMEAQPGLQEQLREGLASTGQLGSGAGTAAFTKLATEAGRTIGQGQTELAIQDQDARRSALRDVFGADTNQAESLLGLEGGTLETVFNSGREDLIREAQQLIAEAKGTSDALLGATQLGQQRQIASDIAGQQASGDLITSLVGTGSNLLGQYQQQQQMNALLKALEGAK